MAEINERSTVVVETEIGALGVIATAEGVSRILLPRETAARESVGARGAATALAREAATQLEEYADGRRKVFEVQLDWDGVDVRHRKVLETLSAAAPFGCTVTYGELGRRAGEDDPRVVGQMMGANPFPLVIPCHRVVAADGVGGYGGGVELKRRLLELENVLPPRLAFLEE
jgi:methylated-DNA-[protein]-cysteine S-methyltransferase